MSIVYLVLQLPSRKEYLKREKHLLSTLATHFVLIFLAFCISCGGESHVSSFTHLIFRLCYLDIELSCGRERLLAKNTLVTFAHYAVLNQSTQHVPTFHINGK